MLELIVPWLQTALSKRGNTFAVTAAADTTIKMWSLKVLNDSDTTVIKALKVLSLIVLKMTLSIESY